MAEQAERAYVFQIALTATLRDRNDVVSVPETAAAGDGLHPVESKAGGTRCSTGAFERGVGGDGIDLADGAPATVAREDLVPEIAGIGSQAPLVDAVVAAEGATAFGDDLEIAPTAERKTVGACGEIAAACAAARKCAWGKHSNLFQG
jgi:hypothetical protein